MNFGYSIDEVIQRSEAKSHAKKLRIKEKKRTEREEGPSGDKTSSASKQTASHAKKSKLSRQERTALLDRSMTSAFQEMPKIEEKELKEVLKIVVKIMNTIPYEAVPINKQQEDEDPHARAKGEDHLRRRDRKRPRPDSATKSAQPNKHAFNKGHKRQRRQ
ncbi:hypothetical protein NEMIN01_1933 [Nematocida minor]|uniref:uncharacterized protein n=1 Tax=Nematocida minor TaxID=1912983 RepID=UPI00221E7BE8|nr:uncharacterized protein NEMIN01_1933 [Nematocida minor]KAI5192304.1 hypothetical protein NEMIN01_1933 [Nematocida minor]